MTIVLYRRSLSLTSGAGQLIRMQAEGLAADGRRVLVACRRGGLRFLMRTGIRPRRLSDDRLRALCMRDDRLVVDHGAELAEADLIFVHNLATEAVRYVEREDWRRAAEQEARFFRALRPDVSIVANSKLVRRALLDRFAFAPERVIVCHPGFDRRRFSQVGGAAAALRHSAREGLRLDERTPLIGFVTSGDFSKRGLDVFLAAADEISQRRPDARFLVVGSKSLPDWAAKRPAVKDGRVIYRPKSTRPERWFAALDLFLYAAHFEEFGIVVLEAQAAGVPVLTSRRVGATETLPPDYDRWLVDEPDSRVFSEKALDLLEDANARSGLAAAGAASVASLDRQHYVERTVRLITRLASSKRGGAPDETESRPSTTSSM